MKIALACITLLSVLSAYSMLPTNEPTNEAELSAMIVPLYNATGVAKEGIHPIAFELAYREYLALGNKVKAPFIIFSDFTKKSGKKRFLVVNVSLTSPGVVGKTVVAHGRRSGSYAYADKFSNKGKSYKSSLGAYQLLHAYGKKDANSSRSSKFKHALKIEGVTSGFNTNAKSRAVVLHDAWYVKEGLPVQGKTLGCFGLSKGKAKKFVQSFRGGKGMIYAFHNNHLPDKTGRCITKPCLPRKKIIASTTPVPRRPESPGGTRPDLGPDKVPVPENSGHFSGTGETQANQMEFGKGKSGFLKMGKLLGISLVGAALLPKALKKAPKKTPPHLEQDNVTVKHAKIGAKYTGSEDVEQCQLLANKPWGEVVTRTQNGEDPHKFFRASWKDLSRTIQSPISVDDYMIPTVSKNHLQRIRECAALAMIYDKRNLTRSNPNQKAVAKSRDGKITCRYQGSEGADYNDCVELIKTHEKFIEKEKKLFSIQESSIIEKGKSEIAKVKGGSSIQSSAHVSQENMRQNMLGMTGERKAFQEARLQGIAKSLSAIPNHKSLMHKCKQAYGPYKKGGIDDYMVFNSYMADAFDYALSGGVSDLSDPCEGAINRLNIKHIHNHHVKKQAEKVLEEVGIERSRLASALKTLDGQKGVNFNSVDGSYNEKSESTTSSEGMNTDDVLSANSRGDNKVYDAQNENSLPSFNRNTDDVLAANSGRLEVDNRDRGMGVNGIEPKKNGSIVSKVNKSEIANESEFDSALIDVQNGSIDKMAGLIKSGSVPWNDALYMYQEGKISKSQIDALASLTRNKVKRLATVNDRNNQNSAFDINKDKDRSIFSIISRRYAKKKLGDTDSTNNK